MIAVVVLFVTGGTTYTELCRPMLHSDPPSGVVRVSTVQNSSFNLGHFNIVQTETSVFAPMAATLYSFCLIRPLGVPVDSAAT